jgi:hypothetical protein
MSIEALANILGAKYEGVTLGEIKHVLARHVNEKLVRLKSELYGLTTRGLSKAKYLQHEGFTL